VLNLLTDPWIPVKTARGVETFICFTDLANLEDPPIAFASVRPDFDGALAQFCIGVFQTLLRPAAHSQWAQFLSKPWKPLDLEKSFAPYTEYFELTNPSGPAFMQDFDPELGGRGKDEPLTGLIINMPGENTEKNNATLFVKAQEHMHVSLPTAAMMLLTLQINAPAGGAGHRTGLRGGGPLTTLVWPQQRRDGSTTTLLERLWCNVLPVPESERPASMEAFKSSLPWSVPTNYSTKGETAVSHWLGSWCYWATPRPIRLVLSDTTGYCSLDHRLPEGPTLTIYRTRNYGNNYPSDKFQHPLSPYYKPKATENSWLPVHPSKENGLTYVDWMAYAVGEPQKQPDVDTTRISAKVVTEASAQERATELAKTFTSPASLWAFGYAMDNDKPLSWMTGLMPMFLGQTAEQHANVRDIAKKMIDAALVAYRALRTAIKESACAIDASELFSRTEEKFYNLLSRARETHVIREEWRKELFSKTLRLFEEAISLKSESTNFNSGSSICSVALLRKRCNADHELRKKLSTPLRLALDLTPPKREIAKSKSKNKKAIDLSDPTGVLKHDS
jgi:CRISPR system Cascade subunit CasA